MHIDSLRRLRTLAATPKMMRLAAQDVPKKTVQKNFWGSESVRETTEYGLYLRCQILNGILKAAIFLPDAMRLGGRLPAWELYINRETGDFLTFDRRYEKWLTAKLDRIDWPQTVHSGRKRWINPEGYASVKRYLGTETGGYEGLLEYQLSVRERQLKARHKRETDPWDSDLARTPPLPKDWARWVDKVGIPENYIFYQYTRRGAKTGYCTFCGKEVPIVRPRHNKTGRCRCCRHAIVFKSIGRAGRIDTPKAVMYLLQRCEGGFMIREFCGRRRYDRGRYMQPEVIVWEARRALFDARANPLRAYYWGDYKHVEFRWIGTEHCSPQWDGAEAGRCYGRTLPTLAARELCFTGLPEMIRVSGSLDPEKYLAIRNSVPQMEQLVKAGLVGLAEDCLRDTYPFRETFGQSAVGSLAKQLGIDRQAMKRLRENRGGIRYLEWLRFEKTNRKLVPDQTIGWLCQEKIDPDALQFILDRMSVPQTANYLRRQMRETGMSSRDVLTTWKDYLSMAKRLGMDTGDAIVYRVRKLRLRHDALVEQMRVQELSLEAGEILERFPRIEEIFETLPKLYAFADADFSVAAPVRIEQVLKEGQELHHCVGSSDRYWERIERRESYILFLRRTEEPEKPFYTLEVEPDGTVRQKRTLYNRQDKDIDAVTAFLQKWQKEVGKRITGQEHSLAAVSRDLRNEEFAQLWQNGVTVDLDGLHGRLLADVLRADLMENKEAAAQTALPDAA